MPDLHGDLRHASDPERLVERPVDPRAFVADVRGVDAPVAAGCCCERNQLVRRRVDGRGVDERAGKAEGPLFHHAVHQRSHVRQLGWRGAPVPLADHGRAELGGSHKGGEVDGRPGAGEVREVAVEVPPVDVEPVFLDAIRVVGDERVGERGHGLAFARDLGRDSLSHLAEQPVVDEDVDLRLPQHVDETRGDDQARDVERLVGLARAEKADGRDPVSPDGEVALVPWVAGPVHDPAILEDQVIRTRPPFPVPRPADEQQR